MGLTGGQVAILAVCGTLVCAVLIIGILLLLDSPASTSMNAQVQAAPLQAVKASATSQRQPTYPPTWTPTLAPPTISLHRTSTPHPGPIPTLQVTARLVSTLAPEVVSRMPVVYVRTSSRSGGEYDLYLMNPDGSESHQLTALSGLETSPAWSPDGQVIAFVGTQDSVQPNDCATGYVELKCNFEIYTIRRNGSDLKRLTTRPTYDRGPTWSPDGTYIAFSSREAGARYGYIYVMTAEGTELTALTNGSVRDTGPAWSPDGRSIAFTRETCCDDKSRTDVYVMAANGHQVKQLTHNGAFNLYPAWSPDGQAIAWIRVEGNSPDAPTRLAIMRHDGTGEITLQPDVSVARGYPPAWSPDGQQLMFVSDAEPRLNIYRINRDGTHLTRVTDDSAYFSAPAWFPILSEPFD